MPRDSATSYFPARVSGGAGWFADAAANRQCRREYRAVSRYLFAFGAPVLSNYYQGQPSYRLLWRGRYSRPLLLTLRRTPDGGVLQTQFLNKHPQQFGVTTLPPGPNPDHPHLTPDERKRLLQEQQLLATNDEYLATAARARAPVVVVNAELVALNTAQVRQFTTLLDQAGFWQLPACVADTGAAEGGWTLEAATAGGYYVVSRHRPGSGLRRCGEYLRSLSPARMDELL
ncbi:hypothetical protein GCM10023185_02300 [Hymenobacter saemangeumensis]|uniref:Uncharacterized protein n=1 Tax=Hymenobacter saemangeumensis TaxID=1084522 RepID=A0ABP8HY65_9BACT